MPTPTFSAMGTNPFGLADVGNYAIPVFVDIDGDGDFDVFIGNNTGNARFFRNTGDTSTPAFSNVGSSPFGLADVGASNAPFFVDIDGDGDFDVFIGNNAGNTQFFRNTGTATAPAFTNVGTNPFGLANVGSYATPTFVDIDGDGDFDAFIGNQAGNIRFFRNTGSSAMPAFSNTGSNPFGLFDVGSYATPTFVDIEGDGDFDALVGNFAGNTRLFQNNGDASSPAFSSPGNNPFGLADVGSSAAPTFVDIDGDGDPDAFIGNRAGNTLFFRDINITADLAVTKTDGVTAAAPGASVNYTIVAANAGPGPDSSVTVSDTFPADLTCTYTSVAMGFATGNTAAGAGDLAETLSLPAGASVVYTADCAIGVGATGTLSNTATISGSATDPDASNNTATDADTVLTPESDLSITKTDGVTSAVPGMSLTYTIAADNAGPSDDPSVNVNDSFPADLTCTYTSVAMGGATGNTAAGAGDLAETLSLPAGASVVYTADCAIDVGASGTLSNTATISGSATDPDASNNTAMDADTVLTPESDLSITKTDGVTAAAPGASVTYTIAADNPGPSDDPSVSVNDSFPADLTCTYTSVAMGGATGNTAAGAGDLAETLSLPAGASVVYTADCAIDVGASGTLSNTATISGSATDPDASNNTAMDADTVLTPESDLSITKTDGVTAAAPGASVTYTIAADNAGPSDDPLVSVNDTFPADLTCTYTSLAMGGATGNTAAGAGDLAETLSLPAGASVVYTADCAIDVGATGTLSNTATISGSVTDPNASNNTATDADTVLTPESDLSITKTDGVTAAAPGASVTYTIAADNAGPSDDPSVSVNDSFPMDLTCTYTSLAMGGATGNTVAGAGDLAETLSLPAGASVVYTADCAIDVGATGTLSNTATISGSVTDPNASNNTATDADTVLAPQADLSVSLTSSATQVTLGDTFFYTVTTTNNGPSAAAGTMVSGALPPGITLISTTGCAEDSTGVPTCSLGTLAPLTTAAHTINVRATGFVQSSFSVTVSSDATDPVGGNNGSSTGVSVAALAVPSLTISGLVLLVLVLTLVALKPLRRMRSQK